jgi:hypothetical protein
MALLGFNGSTPIHGPVSGFFSSGGGYGGGSTDPITQNVFSKFLGYVNVATDGIGRWDDAGLPLFDFMLSRPRKLWNAGMDNRIFGERNIRRPVLESQGTQAAYQMYATQQRYGQWQHEFGGADYGRVIAPPPQTIRYVPDPDHPGQYQQYYEPQTAVVQDNRNWFQRLFGLGDSPQQQAAQAKIAAGTGTVQPGGAQTTFQGSNGMVTVAGHENYPVVRRYSLPTLVSTPEAADLAGEAAVVAARKGSLNPQASPQAAALADGLRVIAAAMQQDQKIFADTQFQDRVHPTQAEILYAIAMRSRVDGQSVNPTAAQLYGAVNDMAGELGATPAREKASSAAAEPAATSATVPAPPKEIIIPKNGRYYTYGLTSHLDAARGLEDKIRAGNASIRQAWQDSGLTFDQKTMSALAQIEKMEEAGGRNLTPEALLNLGKQKLREKTLG